MDGLNREKWFVVQNGEQVDIHCRIFPPNQESREITVLSNIDPADAERTVREHNARVEEQRRDARSELEVAL